MTLLAAVRLVGVLDGDRHVADSCSRLLLAALRAAQSAGICYSAGDFEFFLPRRGDTLHQWGGG